MLNHPSQLSAVHILNRLDAELQRCRDLLERIEEEVLPLVAHPIAPTLRAALQDIDLLSQCLDDISRCVHGVAGSVASEIVIDVEAILSKIRLQDMRLRLEGGQYDSRKLAQKEEMFDTHSARSDISSVLF